MIVHVLAAAFVSVQVGSYSEEGRAQHVVEELRVRGYQPYFLEYDSPEKGAHVFKVRVGAYPDANAGHAAAEKIKALGDDFKGAFLAQTDLVETQTLSADLLALAKETFGDTVDPGHVADQGEGRRLRAWVQNYLTLFLLAAPGAEPGKRLTDLAAWDTNEGNEPELFAVLDGARALALFWRKETSRFEVAELYRAAGGAGTSMGDALDLAPGPEKFICVRYETGGDLYREKGLRFFRWDEAQKSFAPVGALPLEVADQGEEAGVAPRHRIRTFRVLRDKESPLYDGRNAPLLVDDAVDLGNGKSRSHLDLWQWDGARLARVTDPGYFEKVLVAAPASEDAVAGEMGIGIERFLDGDLAGAESVLQQLVTRHPDFEIATRAKHALDEIGTLRRRAGVLAGAGADEVRAGAPVLAEQDLRSAVALDPGNASAWYNLSQARVATGDRLGALQALRRALDLDADGALGLRQKAREDVVLEPLREDPSFKEMVES